MWIRMQRLVGVFFCGIVVVLSGQSWAGWEYTTWGMTPQETANASHGTIHVVSTTHDPDLQVKGGDLEATGMWKQDAVQFDAKFYFGPEGLRLVKLIIAEPNQCEDVFLSLRGRLGTAHAKSELGSDIWRFPSEDNEIRAVDLRHESPLITDCYITYERTPPVEPADSGNR